LFASSQLVQSSTMATFGDWKTRPRSTPQPTNESVEKKEKIPLKLLPIKETSTNHQQRSSLSLRVYDVNEKFCFFLNAYVISHQGTHVLLATARVVYVLFVGCHKMIGILAECSFVKHQKNTPPKKVLSSTPTYRPVMDVRSSV
jgi:hypothetical protein